MGTRPAVFLDGEWRGQIINVEDSMTVLLTALPVPSGLISVSEEVSMKESIKTQVYHIVPIMDNRFALVSEETMKLLMRTLRG